MAAKTNRKAAVSDLRNLSQGELAEKRQSIEKDLYDLRQKKITGQLDKPHLFSIARRQIARILTVMREASHGK